MAILTMMEVPGDPDVLMAQNKETIDPIAEPLFKANGGISHTIVKTDDGIMVVNLWESEEGMETVAAAVKPKAEEAGLTAPRNWRQHEVLDHQT